ncbi:cytochrome P450 [Favolaschia claudopus]|uniref:Cytochrome P450 n=1 Tax=Favolaschia claudopus TaxID=2862362 RepID=A0AAW0BEW9_9AGAR
MNFTLLQPASILVALIFYAIFRVAIRIFRLRYSPLRNLPGPPRKSWFTGNLSQLFNAKGLAFHQHLVAVYGGMVKVHGFFGVSISLTALYISDPQALQNILIKEQDAFEETAVFVETNKVIFGPGLVSTTGEIHKRQRKMVNPIFSPSNLRNLVSTFYEVAERLNDVLSRECRENEERTVIDMSQWMSRAALEAAGQAILGYSFDPLNSPVNNPYTRAIRELIPTMFSLSLVRQFAPFLVRLGPAGWRRRLVEWTPSKAVRKVKMMSDVMHHTAMDILEHARAGLQQRDGRYAKDIISLLLKANERVSETEQLSETELTGQMTVMIFGAQDTASSTLSRILYMLSINPDAQERVRGELHAAGALERRLSLEEVSALPWLDAVLKETLRLYPPVPFVRRVALEDRSIPFMTKQGTQSSIIIPRNTTLFVGIFGANRLEAVWGPDAKEWKPERWLHGDVHQKSEPGSRLPGIYSGMMSFLAGARSCVGYKFAEIEIKIILIVFFSRFRIFPTQDEIVWNLSQIISPSVRVVARDGSVTEEKGLPVYLKEIEARKGEQES